MTTGKREKPFKLDMNFGEAMKRLAATDPKECVPSQQPATYKDNINMALGTKKASQPATPAQPILDLGIQVQRDVNGVEMGVFENGIPFLTQRGLAKLTGAPRSVIYDITKEWEVRFSEEVLRKDRFGFLRTYLSDKGYNEPKLYIETKKDGSAHFAYPDVVCMAILEFYAFEAKSPNPEATQNFRRLAAFGLQKFIYEALHYTPADKWLHHHDRVSLLQSSAPDGYWIVFIEITGLIVDLINADLTVNNKTIPDISVGQAWANYWTSQNLDEIYGSRVQYNHYYPPSFPQSGSNPQLAWAYLDASLPEFRRWFKHDYLVTRFPRYILTKARMLAGGKDEALAIGALYKPKTIAPPDVD